MLIKMKYVVFPGSGWGRFTPIFNPIEMLDMGIFGGQIGVLVPFFKPPDPKYGIHISYYLNKERDPKINQWSVFPDFILNHPSLKRENILTHEWFAWYYKIYTSKQKEPNKDMINYWIRRVKDIYSLYKETLVKTPESEPIINCLKQSLLELGWHYEQEPLILQK
jgi:hypothetical protein